MGEVEQYSWEQVVKNNGRHGAPLWMVYKDIVLDLTNFENEHPGGSSVLQDEGGKDCTRAFDDVGHSSDAKKIMQKYKIGEIVEAERRYLNGKRIVQASSKSDTASGRSIISVISCGIIGS